VINMIEAQQISEELSENLKLCTDLQLLYFITKCVEELTRRTK